MEQLLIAEGVADVPVWQPIVTKLATEAAAFVLPSALAAFGVADPRFFIKVFEASTSARQVSSVQCQCLSALLICA